mmetsp:Transcript_16060/g.60754  ORF Transcript_16060/g.60754 Transcript_16060/m.60754 type:complete len:413 (+) Transcript_16060:845-2083(+)
MRRTRSRGEKAIEMRKRERKPRRSCSPLVVSGSCQYTMPTMTDIMSTEAAREATASGSRSLKRNTRRSTTPTCVQNPVGKRDRWPSSPAAASGSAGSSSGVSAVRPSSDSREALNCAASHSMNSARDRAARMAAASAMRSEGARALSLAASLSACHPVTSKPSAVSCAASLAAWTAARSDAACSASSASLRPASALCSAALPSVPAAGEPASLSAAATARSSSAELFTRSTTKSAGFSNDGLGNPSAARYPSMPSRRPSVQVGPAYTCLPSARSSSWSARGIRDALGWWMVQMMVRFCSCASRRKMVITLSAEAPSSPLVGSSRKMSEGSPRSSAATARRRFSPPLHLPTWVSTHLEMSSASTTLFTRSSSSWAPTRSGSFSRAVELRISLTVRVSNMATSCSTKPWTRRKR